MTGIPPPRHAIVHDTPSGREAILVSAVQVQADGYLGAAKLLCATVKALVSSASG
jgi:hypothetical protein